MAHTLKVDLPQSAQRRDPSFHFHDSPLLPLDHDTPHFPTTAPTPKIPELKVTTQDYTTYNPASHPPPRSLNMSSLKNPRHRRPSWMRDGETYRAHMQADYTRKQPVPHSDADFDGYSYDIAHVTAWKINPDLSSKLAPWFVDWIEDWSAAGAAVQTTLHRITLLDHESLDRGWPERKQHGSLSRTISNTSNTETPQSPKSPTSKSSGARTPQSNNNNNCNSISRVQSTDLTKLVIDENETADHTLETPPFTPEVVNSGSNSPVISAVDTAQLDEKLSTVTTNDSQAITSPDENMISARPFDQPSWERFLDQYKRELEGVKSDDIVRFRHLARKICTGYKEMLAEDNSFSDETRADFQNWWKDMEIKQDQLEKEVSHVSLPTLDEVKRLRVVHGLGV